MVTESAVFAQSFTQYFKTELVAAGIDAALVNAIVITGVEAQRYIAGITVRRTTTRKAGDLSSGAYQTAASMVVIAALKMILGM